MKKTPLMDELEEKHNGQAITEIVLAALRANDTVNSAAAALKIPAPTLANWLARLGIESVQTWEKVAT